MLRFGSKVLLRLKVNDYAYFFNVSDSKSHFTKFVNNVGGTHTRTHTSVVQRNKFKLETKTPSQFVRPVNSITEAKFQLPIPTERLCSMTLKYCHILVLDAE